MKFIKKLLNQIQRLGREDQGLTMVEYAVAGALIAVAAVFDVQRMEMVLGGQAIQLTLRVQLGFLPSFLIPDAAVRDNFDKLPLLKRIRDGGKLRIHIRGRAETLEVSRMYAHRFKAM